jgi:hypothetical protein
MPSDLEMSDSSQSDSDGMVTMILSLARRLRVFRMNRNNVALQISIKCKGKPAIVNVTFEWAIMALSMSAIQC